MNRKTVIMALGGALTVFLYILLSYSLKDTIYMWISTRIFGLVSFVFLFLVVALGEARMLFRIDSKIFRFHKPIAIFAMFLVLLHMVSAIFDKYKWGKYLSFFDYLGFNYSDKWLVFLSFGALAFYLMLVLCMSSMPAGMKLFGFARWRVVHYMGYLCFFIAYIHSVNLGSDIKSGQFSPFVFPFFAACAVLVGTMFFVRILAGISFVSDQHEMAMAALLFLVLVGGAFFIAHETIDKAGKISALESTISGYVVDIQAQEDYNLRLENTTRRAGQMVEVIKDG
jgi:DMSO/TMAO reductase YedYZ heme-binding membrane subunit